MERNVMLAALAVSAALLLAGGAVLAKEIACTAGAECLGTKRADVIEGSDSGDEIAGQAGNDKIFGDPEGDAAGDDAIFGGAGNDRIEDRPDDPLGVEADRDRVFGGKGDDKIFVDDRDNEPDSVDCGPGEDTVFFDAGFDTVTNCEELNPA